MKYDFQTVDPTTNLLKETFATFSQNQIEQALLKAHQAFLTYKAWPFKERALILKTIADKLEANIANFAKTITEEMGKPILESEAEIKKCAQVCRFYAEQANSFLADEIKKTIAKRSLVRKNPLGIILGIMPWNFPFWQIFRVAAPAIIAGNGILLKPANNTPRCGLAIERIFKESNAPLGIFQTLFASHQSIKGIIANPIVKGVTLTGSLKAGQIIAQLAGANMKPCIMELGGSDPFIVFDDAEFSTALNTAIRSRCLNNGQSCIAAKRFLIHQSIFEKFSENLLEKVSKLSIGNPFDPNISIGPLATKKQQKELHNQVLDARNKNAHILCGGNKPKTDGFFYPPTVIQNINSSMRIWCEETFGPIFTLIPFSNDEEALNIANESQYGLGASIWTKNQNRIEHFVENLECGNVFVNDFVRSDPTLPFGGIKNSGFGRELSKEGILAFVNLKTVWENDLISG